MNSEVDPDPPAVEQAFRDFLTSRGLKLGELNLGDAFKVMLEFQRDVKFDWVNPEQDALILQWEELREAGSSSGGFLGIFKTVTAGELIGYQVVVSRVLWHYGSSEHVTLNVVLEYAVKNPEFAESTTYIEFINSDDFDNLEAFVTGVFELNAFKAFALETPLSVEITLELDY